MINIKFLLNRLTILIIIVLISGCSILEEIIEESNEKNISYVVKDKGFIEGVYFCPKDNCSKKIIDIIYPAKEYVHCAFFDIDLRDIKEVLDRKKKEGVDVRLIVDSDNYDMVKDLNITIKQDNRSPYMHNKFCIIDDKKIISGSMNPTENGNLKNNNNIIFIESSLIANNYEDEFQEMWKGTFGKGEKVKVPVIYVNDTKIENYFCPEDNCGEKIEKTLAKAKNSINFMTFSFTHTGIANQVIMKIHEGIEVKGVFEKRGTGSQYSKYNLLEYQGAKLRKDKNNAVMHHKVFIVDNMTIITGSFNPSNNADTRNDENILIISDENIAKMYLKEFENIWEE